jgi:putative endonuclease
MNELQGIVYILTNKNNNVLYTGVTRNLQRRLAEHKLHINQGFSAKYNTEKLVYYEWYDRLEDAIHREKQLKKWHRDWKEKAIADFNPEWKDLAEDIGCDAEYIQAVKDAYELGQYVADNPHAAFDAASQGDSGSRPE